MKDKERISNNFEDDFKKVLDAEKVNISNNENVAEKVGEKLVNKGEIWSDDKTTGETSTDELKSMLLKIQAELDARELKK